MLKTLRSYVTHLPTGLPVRLWIYTQTFLLLVGFGTITIRLDYLWDRKVKSQCLQVDEGIHRLTLCIEV